MSSYGKLETRGTGTKNRRLTWTKTTRIATTKRLTWEALLKYGQDVYKELMGFKDAKEYVESANGNCLVATLCYPAEHESILFQCTIPRGEFHDEILKDGKENRYDWWVHNTQFSHFSGKMVREGPARGLHCEDGAQQLLELAKIFGANGRSLPPRRGPLRMIVYGRKLLDEDLLENGVIIPKGTHRLGQTDLCTNSLTKNPSCTVVARKCGIRFLQKKSARQQDLEDQAAAAAEAEFGDFVLDDDDLESIVNGRRNSPSRSQPNSGRAQQGNSGRTTPQPGDAAAAAATPRPSPGGSRPQTPQPPRQGNNDMNRLAQSMSRLDVGGRPSRPTQGRPSGGSRPGPQALERSEGRSLKIPAARDPRDNQLGSRQIR